VFTNLPLLNNGTKYYVAVTVDANNGQATGYILALDGTVLASQSVAIGTEYGTPDRYVLGNTHAGTSPYSGTVSHVTVYNTVKSVEWIKTESSNLLYTDNFCIKYDIENAF
jgi:hypothetical protein